MTLQEIAKKLTKKSGTLSVTDKQNLKDATSKLTSHEVDELATKIINS